MLGHVVWKTRNLSHQRIHILHSTVVLSDRISNSPNEFYFFFVLLLYKTWCHTSFHLFGERMKTSTYGMLRTVWNKWTFSTTIQHGVEGRRLPSTAILKYVTRLVHTVLNLWSWSSLFTLKILSIILYSILYYIYLFIYFICYNLIFFFKKIVLVSFAEGLCGRWAIPRWSEFFETDFEAPQSEAVEYTSS